MPFLCSLYFGCWNIDDRGCTVAHLFEQPKLSGNRVSIRDAHPASAPRKMAAPGRPGPEKFQECPAPPQKCKKRLPRASLVSMIEQFNLAPRQTISEKNKNLTPHLPSNKSIYRAKRQMNSFTIFIWFFFWVQTNPSLTRDKTNLITKQSEGWVVLTYYRDSERWRENFFRINCDWFPNFTQ